MSSQYCHCCHRKRELKNLVQCTHSRTGRPHAWCRTCITNWLDVSPQFWSTTGQWICPRCAGRDCPCSACQRKVARKSASPASSSKKRRAAASPLASARPGDRSTENDAGAGPSGPASPLQTRLRELLSRGAAASPISTAASGPKEDGAARAADAGGDAPSPCAHARRRTPEEAAAADARDPAKGWSWRDVRPAWEPPPSPYGLIQEQLYAQPWRLLVACFLLNMTSATQVRNVVWRLFALVPDPDAAAQLSDFDRIERLLRPLGLFRKRARTIAAMSARYVAGGWGSVRELPGVGPYAADAWEIFVEGRWRTCAPQDKELRRYVEFMAETDGLGAGLERDPIPELSAGSSDAPGSDSPHWSDR